ncbi:hypothetical protein [Sphingomonas parapaucimobilis]|uniref:DUF927 domain-containing protein n=1 Tax=Sphingomonas parapaucimobilis NBRC 15100 TaxID=1219049 RepID=A0A0A1W751_9SPHN|nr:hypothetical protein [Sphingomonas parapaucimobilis]GAM00729.1 hypothetical protein SP5_035_01300 [Sphingomonas parapaucimobilis NBRC 15100]
MSAHLQPVREALSNLVEPPIDPAPGDPFDAANDGGGDDDRFGRPPRVMPEGCPVVPVGTEDGVFYFLTALGELRGLTCDKVANKHIVGMFAPDSAYLMDEWPRKKMVKSKGPDGEDVEEWIVTGWRNDDVAMLLMDVAAAKGVWNPREKVRGRGAWIDDQGGLILHCGNHVLMGGRWHKPGEHDGRVYPTMPAIPRPGRGGDVTGEMLAPNLVGSLRARGIEIPEKASPGVVLLELYKTWNWARPLIDPMLLIGWDGAAMLGGALDYRPLAWLTGDKATGKSALQKVKGWLFDGGILQSPDASEAGVRQVLGQQSLPVAIDEAEADQDNRKILALVKLARLAASSQGNIVRGGQDHTGHEFQATSCFLFSSILVPPMPPQDRSRLAMLELGELPAGSREPKMDKGEINAIGAWLRRRLADRWHLWAGTLERYTDALIDHGGQGGRAADQFGTLLAAAHILLDDDMPDDEALLQWGSLLSRERLGETAEAQSESEMCVAHMASSLVQLARSGTPRLISDWLLQATEPVLGGDVDENIRGRVREAADALAKVGMRIVTGKANMAVAEGAPKPAPGRDYVAVAITHQGLSRVFENSRWKEGVWTQALKRMKGASWGVTQRIGGSPTKCTLVPVDQIIQRDDVVATVRESEEV